MKNRYKILIAEDDPFIRKVLRYTLQDDFEVSTHINGLEAMLWLEQGQPVDLILTDLQMPYVGGQELIQNIRAGSLFRHLPIIIISAMDDSNTRIKCLELGADDYVTKPFNPMEIKAKIMAVLRRIEQRSVQLPNPVVAGPRPR
ncbi:response regulator [Nibrella viscosa]|uniref:Response regulator n=1 Tax=Nibrella viscosa TaxID=1084524 RepID=A0ABP8KUH8_9BACT